MCVGVCIYVNMCISVYAGTKGRNILIFHDSFASSLYFPLPRAKTGYLREKDERFVGNCYGHLAVETPFPCQSASSSLLPEGCTGKAVDVGFCVGATYSPSPSMHSSHLVHCSNSAAELMLPSA